MGTNSLTRFYRLFKNRFHLIKSPPQIADFSYCLLAIFTNTLQNSKIVLNRNCIKTVLSNFIFFLLSAENVKLQMINFKYFFFPVEQCHSLCKINPKLWKRRYVVSEKFIKGYWIDKQIVNSTWNSFIAYLFIFPKL